MIFIDSNIPMYLVIDAKELLQRVPELGARDALHWAVMRRYGIQRILSFDSDFDRCPDVKRVWQV